MFAQTFCTYQIRLDTNILIIEPLLKRSVIRLTDQFKQLYVKLYITQFTIPMQTCQALWLCTSQIFKFMYHSQTIEQKEHFCLYRHSERYIYLVYKNLAKVSSVKYNIFYFTLIFRKYTLSHRKTTSTKQARTSIEYMFCSYNFVCTSIIIYLLL